MGPVGAGKSTILLGILGEALASSSSLASANCVIEVNVRALPSGFGYVAQESTSNFFDKNGSHFTNSDFFFLRLASTRLD
jgi:ABC-type multidrug transport system ATPase subunit